MTMTVSDTRKDCDGRRNSEFLSHSRPLRGDTSEPNHALPHLKRYATQGVASTKMLPKMRRRPRGRRHKQDGKARIVDDAAGPLLEFLQEV